jgi:PAT family beta-lactamase induction signal transducer AmpG
LIIFLLGISSALPLALISSTFKILLSEKGFGLEFIGSLSLLTIPYSLKFLFAPIIDSYQLPLFSKLTLLSKSLGQRKSWIIFLQILLAILIVALGFASVQSSKTAIIIFGLLLAITSSCQDVAIDGYRVELFDEKNQALSASFYIYGYRFGLLISGAFALILAEIIPWELVYATISLFMIFCFVFSFFANETKPSAQKEESKNKEKNQHRVQSWFKDRVFEPFLQFSQRQNWLAILAFIAVFKLSDGIAGNLTGNFLREIGFSKAELSTILKSFGLVSTLIGVMFGGILVRKIGLNFSLWIAIIMQGSSNLALSLQALHGYEPKLLYLVILIENLSGGIGDVVFVAYLSGLCNREFSATQYALLSSVATLSRSFLSSTAGVYATLLGWNNFFLITAALSIFPMTLLAFISFKNLASNAEANNL